MSISEGMVLDSNSSGAEMKPSKISCDLLHHGAAATSSSKAVLCIPSSSKPSSDGEASEILYASHAMLNVAHMVTANVAEAQEPVWSVHQTLRTDTKGSATANSTVSTYTAKRVVSCISLVKLPDDTGMVGSTIIILCGFSDGTVTSWQREGPQWSEAPLIIPLEPGCDGRSVTDIGGVQSSNNLSFVTCSSGGAFHYLCKEGALPPQKCELVQTPANAVRYHKLSSGSTILLIGTAAPRHNKIHVFLNNPKMPQYCGALTGHEDWITCFDWHSLDKKIDYLASGSQDGRIRLWRFAPSSVSAVVDIESIPDIEALVHTESKDEHADDEDDDDKDDQELEEGESRLEIVSGESKTSVILEALLIGHEERVTSIAWHPDPRRIYGEDLILISSSMDRSIFIWGEISGIWTPISRVGSAGGILGGSIGSSLLGFLNVQLEPDHGRWMLGHGYGGALHFFVCDIGGEEVELSTSDNLTSEDRAAQSPWRAQPCITGHFDEVSDLCWEATYGDYLITTGNDQTCRCWAPLDVVKNDGQDEGLRQVWVEIARPQVHGHDLSAVASLSSSDHRHLFVSGADEKELRVFDATTSFDQLLQKVSPSTRSSLDTVERVERAYIPSLGLSNKAIAAEGAEQDGTGMSESRTQLPLERDLGALSLWPEVRKLYGHNTEVVRLACTISAQPMNTPNQTQPNILVASSTKARNVEEAAIRLWNVADNRCVQFLTGGHRSTVTAMSFSPDEKILISSGKDRRLCVWERSKKEDAGWNSFSLTCAVDSAHKRIVWSVHFCPFEPTIFASGSRDGMVKLWKVCSSKDATNVQELLMFEPASLSSNGKPAAITSIAFAPGKFGSGNTSLLAVGLENGMIELWTLPVSGGPKENAFASLAYRLPLQLCHIAAVTKLAWRPLVAERPELMFASSSEDHGCRIFSVCVQE